MASIAKDHAPNAAAYLRILSDRDKAVRARAKGEDLIKMSPSDIGERLRDMQATRVRLYNAWETALRRVLRCKDQHSQSPGNSRAKAEAEANMAVCTLDYQETTRELTGAFNAVSADIIRIQKEFQRRASELSVASANAPGSNTDSGKKEYSALASSIASLQKLEAEKLGLTARMHQLRWRRGESNPDDIQSAQERLAEIIETIQEVLLDVKLGSLEFSNTEP